MSESNPKSRPGAHWYLTGAVLIIMGPIALGWSLWVGSQIHVGVDHQRFTAPGSASLLITEAGEYTLWRILDQGAAPPIPGDLRIVIVDPALGGAYELEPLMGLVERLGDRSRAVIAQASLPHRGPYEIVIEGDFPQSEFEFGASTGSEFAPSGIVTPRLSDDIGAGLFTLSTALFGSVSILGILAGGAMIVFVWIARDRTSTSDQGQD